MQGFVYIVDADESYRADVQRRLEKAGYQVEVYSSGRQLLDRLPTENDPSCVLLDLRLPDTSGIELQGRLRELGSTLPIVFFSASTDTAATVRALKGGAVDFLTKPVECNELLRAIKKALEHHRNLCQARSTLDEFRAGLVSLTPRERQVFGFVVRGKLNKQIAVQLGMAERTVKAHRHA